MVTNSECAALRDEALELRLSKFIAHQHMNFHVLKSPQCTHFSCSPDPTRTYSGSGSATVEEQIVPRDVRREFLLSGEKPSLPDTDSIPLFEYPMRHTKDPRDHSPNGTTNGTASGKRPLSSFVKLPVRKTSTSSGRASPLLQAQMTEYSEDRTDRPHPPGASRQEIDDWAAFSGGVSRTREGQTESEETELSTIQSAPCPPPPPLTSGSTNPTVQIIPPTPASVIPIPFASAAGINQLSNTGPTTIAKAGVRVSPTVSFARGAFPAAASQPHRLLQTEVSLAESGDERHVGAAGGVSPDGVGDEDGHELEGGGQTRKRLRCAHGRLQRRPTLLNRRTAAARSMTDAFPEAATSASPPEGMPLAATARSRVEGPEENGTGLRKSRQSTRFEHEMQLHFIKC